MRRFRHLLPATGTLWAVPLVAAAQATTIQSLVSMVGSLLNALIPVLIAAALVVFFWGLVRYVWGAAGGETKVEARTIMIAGLVALFVMVSVWGIVRFMQSSLGIGGSQSIEPPRVPSRGQGTSGSGNTPWQVDQRPIEWGI